MAKRFWIYLALTLVIISCGWLWARAHAAQAVLRSEHSEPAVTMPAQMVAIVPEGKQFHDPSCRYLHGKPQMVPAEQAVKMGYTPDPRCMRRALQK